MKKTVLSIAVLLVMLTAFLPLTACENHSTEFKELEITDNISYEEAVEELEARGFVVNDGSYETELLFAATEGRYLTLSTLDKVEATEVLPQFSYRYRISRSNEFHISIINGAFSATYYIETGGMTEDGTLWDGYTEVVISESTLYTYYDHKEKSFISVNLENSERPSIIVDRLDKSTLDELIKNETLINLVYN